MTPIGILGGTFDPVHFGHLRAAAELYECLDLAEVRFVPCRVPPHGKVPGASAAQRRSMLAAAISDTPEFQLDDRELRRDGPSYSVDTLESMRAEQPDRPLCLIVGMDAFASLPSWHRWERLIELAHLVVAERPGAAPPESDAVLRLLEQCQSRNPADLHAAPAGRILLHTVTQLEISSRAIREMVGNEQSPRYLVPRIVADMIAAGGCYRRGDHPARARRE